jgi:hypothetical protein
MPTASARATERARGGAIREGRGEVYVAGRSRHRYAIRRT